MHLDKIPEINKDIVVVWGDSHGDWRDLRKFLNENKNTCVIHVGDFGVFNRHSSYPFIQLLDEICEDNNNILLTIRGNHDFPDNWKVGSWLNTENITFVPDYSYYKINGKVFFFVGGATSIDRIWRRENVSYWKDETFLLRDDYKSLAGCDVLITHSSGCDEFPIGGFSKIGEYLRDDPPLREELIQERKDIQTLYEHVKPKIAHFWGHFHESSVMYKEGVLQRCLDIDEVVEITQLLK